MMAMQPILNLMTDSLFSFMPLLAEGAQPKGDLMMPPSASNFSDGIDFTFWLIFWVSTISTVGIGALMVIFPILYRQKDKQKVAHGWTHSTPLELSWTVPPLIFVLVIFAIGFRQYVDMVEAPSDAIQIDVKARQWAWDFYYPTGEAANMETGLHLMAGENYKFNLYAEDVLHAFFIPQFRIKKDCVPGREAMAWVRPKTAEEMGLEDTGQTFVFDLYCAEYCGTSHSNMNAKVYVYNDRALYEETLKTLSDIPANTDWITWAKEKIVPGAGCASCHSVDGSSGNGPTWENIVGETFQYTDGSSVAFDYDHMVESIAKPQKVIRNGYTGVNMSAYQFSTAEYDALYAYMAELSGKVEPWMDKPVVDTEGSVIGMTRKAWLEAGSPADVTDLLGKESTYKASDAEAAE